MDLLEKPSEAPASALDSSLEEAISSMSEASADSSNRLRALPNGLAAMNSISSEDEDGSLGQNDLEADDELEPNADDAVSSSGGSTDSSTTAASVPAEPLPDFVELVEKVFSFEMLVSSPF